MANGQALSEAVPRRQGVGADAWLSDRQLLEIFNTRRGASAEAAFAALVDRHGPMILRVCRQVLGDGTDAEDAFQATFLVLARRAGSIRSPELVANWLYGVALRAAREVKMRDARRRRHESLIAGAARGEAPRTPALPDAELIEREQSEILHEEVSRLPERYRVAIVLCELEGLTYQEAARRLRCPVGTLGVRLSRARRSLRTRLLRRGIVPAAAFAALRSGAAPVPAALLDSTARAAVGLVAGDAAGTGLVSATVGLLTEAVLKGMALTRLKLASCLALLGCLTATVGGIGLRQGLRELHVAAPPPVVISPRIPIHGPAPAMAAPAEPTAATLAPAPEPIAADEPAAAVVPALLARPAHDPARDEVTRGEMLFAKEWAVNDPLTPRGDGLGPLYNDTSCVACHGQGGPGGAGPASKNVVILSLVSTPARARLKQLEEFHPGFRGARSVVLHRFGTDPAYDDWRRRIYQSRPETPAPEDEAEESVEARIERLSRRTASQQRLLERTTRLQPSPGLDLKVAERNAPALFGVGQIDAIPSEAIVREAAEQPKDVRGRVNRGPQGRVGRFGWKAQVATLHEFVRGACAGELGLEVASHHQPTSPLDREAKAKGLDLAEPDCDALVAYVRALPAPVAVDPGGPGGTAAMAEGRHLFEQVGCATCHAPSLGPVRGIYSDLLLHDLGRVLADDGRSYGIEGPEFPGGPSPREWRTPPLWGFRDSGPYLHDGRAETLEEAVALHGGQAAAANRRFFSLPAEDRARIESFLKSLVAPSAAALPGMILASELESRIKPESVRQAEARVRKRRELAALREEQLQKESRRRKHAAEAARRAQIKFPIAANLEKQGKLPGALQFYREIAREAPDTAEGQAAVARLASLQDPSE